VLLSASRETTFLSLAERRNAARPIAFKFAGRRVFYWPPEEVVVSIATQPVALQWARSRKGVLAILAVLIGIEAHNRVQRSCPGEETARADQLDDFFLAEMLANSANSASSTLCG
jgi:hypothetical protein